MDKIRLSKLDEVTKQKAPYEVSMVLYGATGLIMLTQLGIMGASGLYSPGHTNSFSIIASTLVQGCMMIGCGGLTGLSYGKFSVLPSVSKNIKTDSNSASAWLSGSSTSLFIPYACAFASLTLMDSMILYGVAPAIFGFGVLGTSTFFKA